MLYVAALLGVRWAWTAAFAAYFGHFLAAFGLHFGWSHAAAMRRTGFGIYLNYAFTAIWFADVAWLQAGPGSYDARARWISIAVHAFMAFMFFNATVVFASGWTRWLGATATVLLVVVKLRSHGTFPPTFSGSRGRGISA